MMLSIMLEVTVTRSAAQLLKDLQRRGLVIKLDTYEKRRQAHHWHLGFEKQPGVIEVTDLGDRCVLKVASNRDGGWASALARELAKSAGRKRS